MNKNIFSELFNKYRLKAQFETLSQIGEALAREGIVYEDSIFSRWKNGSRIPKKRTVVLSLIKIFIERLSINSTGEANELLHSTGLRYLSYRENIELFKPFLTYKTAHPSTLEIGEADTLFLAQKILGTPFVILNEEKIKKIHTIYKKNLKELINIFKKIESNPSLVEIYASQATNTELTLHEEERHTYKDILLKKILVVNFPDKTAQTMQCAQY